MFINRNQSKTLKQWDKEYKILQNIENDLNKFSESQLSAFVHYIEAVQTGEWETILDCCDRLAHPELDEDTTNCVYLWFNVEDGAPNYIGQTDKPRKKRDAQHLRGTQLVDDYIQNNPDAYRCYTLCTYQSNEEAARLEALCQVIFCTLLAVSPFDSAWNKYWLGLNQKFGK
jgi:hypothetical protein